MKTIHRIDQILVQQIGVCPSLITWGCSIGVQLGLWSYGFEVLPFILAYLPNNLALMHVVVIGLFQFRTHVFLWVKSIIFGLLLSYIGETFF
ncbi:hypothetical protein [Rossellomorea sp. YZS02]|uniref:hypothetical protein n=1 Tax=Rossellomorea sp. YZS02 TaxID=3097358 RepID=UPI002A0CE520|nr:hypothetical protein [Rossellomorea sp. YZS02]MDX8342537.1 hypothetical protein [Rossellomorea sp. YZS02]